MITLQFRIKKYLPLLFTIFISTIFLSNCARLPKPSIKNKTILVVIDEFVNTSKMPPQMRMKFHITTSGLKGNFYVTPSNGNAIIPTLEPGNYRIEGYSSQPIGRSSKGRSKIKPLSINFELKRNQITVLNKKLVYTQKPYDSRGGWRANWSIKTVTNSEKKKTLSLLRKDENFSLWRIYEEKKYVQKPKPVPVPEPKIDKGDCGYRFYVRATEVNTVKSFRNFLNKCNDPGSSYYSIAYRTLNNKLKTKKSSPVKPSVVSPKVTASPPKVSDQSERPETIIIPVSGIGDVSNTRKLILENTLTDELKKHFRIVPQEKYEQVLEQVFKELEYEECSEDACIMRVQEMLQVENVFNLQIIREGKDSQLNLKWITLDEKKNKTDVCLGCGTFQLNDKVRGLVEKLVGR